MRERKLCWIVMFLALAIAGCSSSDDDGGGSSGGSGTLATCQSVAGVYSYPDGSRLEIMPDCEFIYTDPDGNYGHGKVNSASEDRVSLDLRIDTGPGAGTCSTVIATPDSFSQTNISQC